MKRLVIAVALVLLCAALAAGQDPPKQEAGGGLLYDNGAGANGMVYYAHAIAGNQTPTYWFTLVRITGMEGNPFVQGATPFKLLTTQETGVAQYIKRFWRTSIYGLGTFGSSQTSNDGGLVVGNSISAGGLAAVPLGKGWSAKLIVAWNKPSLAEHRFTAGLAFGWGE